VDPISTAGIRTQPVHLQDDLKIAEANQKGISLLLNSCAFGSQIAKSRKKAI
jgi:hypothetical protein